MKCPNCTNVDLVMSERQGVEIDYCPSCRGIWLDRGELDKILDKAMSNEKGSPFYQQSPQQFKEYRHHDSHDYHKHRKKHWLSEFFD
ncbi:MAG: zf-TFIIB domain-containing protein [Bacteroidetes bacterium]|nr:zf-TFIIB domain-containing protein [Bacteroidota bacterium]